MTITTDGLRHRFTRTNNNTAISRADFEANFYRTTESIDFTFGGWDGKSYAGETRHARIWMCNIDGYELCEFIKVGKSIHMVYPDDKKIELATGKAHPTVGWVVDVARA